MASTLSTESNVTPNVNVVDVHVRPSTTTTPPPPSSASSAATVVSSVSGESVKASSRPQSPTTPRTHQDLKRRRPMSEERNDGRTQRHSNSNSGHRSPVILLHDSYDYEIADDNPSIMSSRIYYRSTTNNGNTRLSSNNDYNNGSANGSVDQTNNYINNNGSNVNAAAATTTAANNNGQSCFSLTNILESLNMKMISFSIIDIIRYTILALGVVITLLYLFPRQIVLIMLLLIFIVLLMIGLILRRLDGPSRNDVLTRQPINTNKLNKLRQELMLKRQIAHANALANANVASTTP